jgi:NAD(P)-dependent dehydrogenase (short-subunit alcohol dehydrogenase family)
MRFSNKNVLVTGSGRGIGRAIALAFAREGASVAVNSLHGETAEPTAEDVRRLGRKAVAIVADVSVEDQVNAMVDRTVQELGGLDILVNNAGVSQPIMPTVEQSTEDWDRVIDVNLRGTYLCVRAAGRWMVKKGSGKVVNIASAAGLTGQPMRTAYAPSKAAVINLTRDLAVEWAASNINVNSVAPGYVLTDLVAGLLASGRIDEKAIVRRTPLGRLSTVEDIAHTVLFLASDEARNITGVNIPVDAGWTANGWYM